VEKRTKLEPLGKKCIIFGYKETLKAYSIFILAQRKIIMSRDVMFEENLASRSSHESSTMTKEKEQQSIVHTSSGEEELSPSRPAKRPRWILQTSRDVDEAPRSVAKECMPSRKFSDYMALMSSIIDVEP
jgi:hypothetical protein